MPGTGRTDGSDPLSPGGGLGDDAGSFGSVTLQPFVLGGGVGTMSAEDFSFSQKSDLSNASAPDFAGLDDDDTAVVMATGARKDATSPPKLVPESSPKLVPESSPKLVPEKPQEVRPPSPTHSEATSDGEHVDEAEMERLMALAKKKSKALPRQKFAVDADFKAPVYQKTFEQHEHIISACASSFLFSTLSPENLKIVVDAFRGPNMVAPGTYVITEGAQVTNEEPGLFIIESGELSVFKAKQGIEKPGVKVHTYTRIGDSFGDLALLYNCPRAATVIARTECILWSIDAHTFNHLVKGAAMGVRQRFDKMLDSVDILKGLSDVDRHKIADVLQFRTHAKGASIIRKGEAGNEFFIVEQGTAYASINGQRVKEYGPMDYFGELALTTRQPRAADVFADSASTVLAVLDGEDFNRLLGDLKEVMAERAKQYNVADLHPSQNRKQKTENVKTEYGLSAEEEKSTTIAQYGGSVDKVEEYEMTGSQTMKDNEWQCGITEKKASEGVTRAAVSDDKCWEDFTPPVYAKTPAQRSQIEAACLRSFLFSSLPRENLSQVIDAFKGPVEVRAGATIIHEGDTVQQNEPALYLLDTGKLKVFKEILGARSPGELTQTLDKSGWIFGELALLYNCKRTATVITEKPSTLYSIDRDTFHNCVTAAMKRRRSMLCRFLESVEVCEGLSLEDRLKLAEALQVSYYQEGDCIIRQGDVGTQFFILEEGSAHASADGKVLKEYGPRDFFGELALLHEQPRVASVIAQESPTVCLVLDADSFARIVGRLGGMMQRVEAYSRISTIPHPPENIDLPPLQSEIESDEEYTLADEDQFVNETDISRRKGRRFGVCTETMMTMNANWTPPVHRKTTMQFEQIKAACMKSFIFTRLDTVTLETVINAFKGPTTYPRATEIIRQGDKVTNSEPALFVLEKGKLDVFRHKAGQVPPGNLVTVLETSGCAFGEIALMQNCPRTAGVSTRSESVLWSLDRETYLSCVKGADVARRFRMEAFLGTVEILHGISKEETCRLVEVLQTRSYKRGQVIIRKGDLSDEFFILQEGTAFAILNGQRVREYGPNQYFGELALMYRQPRMADVIAASSPTVLGVLDAEQFKRILGNLQGLLIQKAQDYSAKAVGGHATWLMHAHNRGSEWICQIKSCSFRNFARAERCLKCGLSRTSTTSVVPYTPLQIMPVDLPMYRRPQLLGAVPVVYSGITLSGAEEHEVHMVYAAYLRRLSEVGVVQGTYPLVPGEFFQVSIHSLGTFGEISIGLAPSAEDIPTSKHGKRERAKQKLEDQCAPAKARGSSMVGWGTREFGITGDHGRWRFRGQLPGQVVTPPWEAGDVLECGLDEGGGAVYVKRNGARVVCENTYWPVEDAYPTVTFHSGGAEVLLDLRKVTRKRPTRAAYEHSPAKMAQDLLSGLKRTVLNTSKQGSSMWCGCTDVHVRRPETLSAFPSARSSRQQSE